MANMSYCRFRNTSGDLVDCICAIQEACDGEYSISEEERAAGKKMFREFLNYCEDMGIIEGYDRVAIDCLFDNQGGNDDEQAQT